MTTLDPLTTSPAPGAPGATARAALRGLPGAIRRATVSPGALCGAAAGFLIGLLGTWVLSSMLQTPATFGTDVPPPAAMATSYLLLLLSLSASLAWLPVAGGPGWRFGISCVRTIWWASCGFAGLYMAGGTSFSLAATLWLVTAAFVATWIGLGGLLAWWMNGRRAWVRPLLAVGLTLCVTGLLWSRPWLLSAYRISPAAGSVASRGVLAGGPVTGLAAAWQSNGGSLDLIKGPLTYQIWIGSYHPPSYPALWPHEGKTRIAAADGGFETRTRWMPGLIIALLSWALPVLLLCDALGWLTLRKTPPPSPT